MDANHPKIGLSCPDIISSGNRSDKGGSEHEESKDNCFKNHPGQRTGPGIRGRGPDCLSHDEGRAGILCGLCKA